MSGGQRGSFGLPGSEHSLDARRDLSLGAKLPNELLHQSDHVQLLDQHPDAGQRSVENSNKNDEGRSFREWNSEERAIVVH